MPKKPEENPLFGKNIPPPPPTTSTKPSEDTLGGAENGQTVSTVSVENDRRGDLQDMLKAPTTDTITGGIGEERATIELSLYLRPTQDDKLEDLRRAYKRRTGKKISANEVMRRLIERATLDTLL